MQATYDAQVYVHMGGDCSKKRGISKIHNKLQGLLNPLHQHGFAVRPRSGAERVGGLDWLPIATYLLTAWKFEELSRCKVSIDGGLEYY